MKSWSIAGPYAGLVSVIAALAVLILLLPLSYAALAIVGGSLFLLLLVRPEIGLYLLVFSIPFESFAELQLGAVAVSSTEFLAVAMALSWLAHRVISPREKIAFPPLIIPLSVLIVGLLMSVGGAISVRLAAKELFKWVEFLAIYGVAALTLGDSRKKSLVVFLILAAASLEALIGYYQFFGRLGPPSFAIGPFSRAYGTFGQPNPYAGYLGMTIPLVVALTLWNLPPKGQWAAALAFGVIAFLLAAAMAMSLSRGSWLGLAAGLGVVLALWNWRVLVGALAAVASLFILMELGLSSLLPGPLALRLADIVAYFGIFDVRTVTVTAQNWPIVERMAQWQAAWGMFESRPLFGVGIGNYPVAYPDFAMPDWPEAKGHAHNIYLNFLAEAGVIGLAGFLAFWLAGLWRVFRAAVNNSYAVAHDKLTQLFPQKALAAGVLGVLVAVSVHNIFDNLFVHGMYAHLALLLGLVLGIVTRRDA